METKVKWFVSLSDGQTLFEGKGDYKVIKGELSPWQRLLKTLDKRRITSLSLYTDDGKRFNLPSAGKNPKFKVFADAEMPESYNFFRKAGSDIMEGQVQNYEVYTVIEAIYKDKKLQLWVSEANPDNCWTLVC